MDNKIGVLLVNLGTPAAPTKKALRKYLAEFLSDRRVIEISKILWSFILYGFILNTRPKKSAKKYASIWTEKGSPLLVITESQAEKIQARLPDNYSVDIAMRYGDPSIEKGIRSLIKKGVNEIIIFPLYPQYSSATIASVSDKVGDVLKNERYFPTYRVLGAYYNNIYFIKACAQQILVRTERASLDRYVFSYHGMPKKTYELGDPYYDQCLETTRLIAKEMNEPIEKFDTVFQSRFGKETWLQPYAAEYFNSAPAKGIKNIAVFCPGFSADCLETLEEMADENKLIFLGAGGEIYQFIPCLNDSNEHIDALLHEILR